MDPRFQFHPANLQPLEQHGCIDQGLRRKRTIRTVRRGTRRLHGGVGGKMQWMLHRKAPPLPPLHEGIGEGHALAFVTHHHHAAVFQFGVRQRLDRQRLTRGLDGLQVGQRVQRGAVRRQVEFALHGGAAQAVHRAHRAVRFLFVGIEQGEGAMVFAHRRKRHGVVEAADHLLRRRRMSMYVVEILRQVPSHEARAEQVARPRHLVRRRSYAHFGAAHEGVAAGEFLHADQRGTQGGNREPAAIIQLDLFARSIEQQNLVFGGEVGILIAVDARKAGGGEQQFGGKLLGRVHYDKRRRHIQPTRAGLLCGGWGCGRNNFAGK